VRETTAFDLASRFIGTKEIAGTASNPLVLAMLRLDNTWPDDDEVPWCSAFVNFVAWMLRLPRSKSLAARSWLQVGKAVEKALAIPGYDVVILQRGDGAQPGAEVISAPGHVGFFAGDDRTNVHIVGGNQNNSVSVEAFPVTRILGIRRLGSYE